MAPELQGIPAKAETGGEDEPPPIDLEEVQIWDLLSVFQRLMKEIPDITLVCQVCKEDADISILAPGALEEPFESKRKQ